MNILATATGYPVDRFHTAPLDSATDLWLRTSISCTSRPSGTLLTTRPMFRGDDAGPFIIFCDDMQPSNMLIDPETLRITVVLGFEFSNSMPAQFAYDPPWWLLLRGPGVWIEEEGIDSFLARYVPRMEQFLRALSRVQVKSCAVAGKPLSARMRDSWSTGRFWFNYASRRCLDIDAVYWAALHDPADGDGLSLLDPEVREKLVPLVRKKMEQLGAYDREYAARLE
ncbi:hypothetical protein VTK56DRAFT_5112 [Thermocarpiscus australiensis]